MYRGGLIFGAIGQVILTIILVAIAVAWPSINSVVGEGIVNGNAQLQSSISGFGDSSVTASLNTFTSVADTISIALGIVAAIQFIFTMVTFAALSNFAKAKRGERDFNGGLAVAAGVLNLLGNIIAGILILVGISDARREVGENTSQNRSRQGRRSQDDYTDRRVDDRHDRRRNGYSRDEREHFDDERPRRR